MKRTFLIGGALAMLIMQGLCSAAGAGEMSFSFINPSFGGNPLNGSYLLSMASAQNDFTEDKDRDEIAEFEEELNQRLLSELSSRLIDEAFGTDDGLRSGSYEIGDYSIDIDTGAGDGINVNIFDQATGGTTNLNIPRY